MKLYTNISDSECCQTLRECQSGWAEIKFKIAALVGEPADAVEGNSLQTVAAIKVQKQSENLYFLSISPSRDLLQLLAKLIQLHTTSWNYFSCFWCFQILYISGKLMQLENISLKMLLWGFLPDWCFCEVFINSLFDFIVISFEPNGG